MKRVLAAAVQTSVLLCLCLFLARQYFTHNSFSETIQEVKTYLPNKPFSANVPIQLEPPAPSPPGTVTGDASRTEGWEATVIPPESTAVPIDSPEPSSTEALLPELSLATSSPSTDRPKNASIYIHSIMHPDDPLFPRLECPTPTHDRYDYLKPLNWSPSSPRPKPKYFFALDLYQCAPILPRLLGSIVETMRFLGPENCVLSIVEGRSSDGTFEILDQLRESIESTGAAYFFDTNDVNPKGGEGVDRIQALADLRNQALLPLTRAPQEYDPDTTVLFVNDISLCMEDMLELIHQRVFQKADMTCGMDWIFGGWSFYDVWISRGMNGDQFFEIPQSGTWDFADNLFWNDPKTRKRFDAVRPFQVFSCWNGVTAFTARPLLEHRIGFRTNRRNECYLGEPTFFCKDLWYEGYYKIAVIPSVNVGYDDDESRKIKAGHGTVSSWVEKEDQSEVPQLIKWESKPPEKIKCVPNYTNPTWESWDQGLDIAKVMASER